MSLPITGGLESVANAGHRPVVIEINRKFGSARTCIVFEMEHSPAAVKSPGVRKVTGDDESLVGAAVGSIADIELDIAAPAIVVIVLKSNADDRIDPVFLAVARSRSRSAGDRPLQV